MKRTLSLIAAFACAMSMNAYAAPVQSAAPAQPAAPAQFAAPAQPAAPAVKAVAAPAQPAAGLKPGYGELAMFTRKKGTLFAEIRFPSAARYINKTVKAWAFELFADADAEVSALLLADRMVTAEIQVQYDSYLVEDKYVGIVEHGFYKHSQMERPEDIVKAFNFDLKRRAPLALSDIILPDRYGEALQLLRKKILDENPGAAELLRDMDESWLANSAVGHEGLVVALKRGEFFPDKIANMRFTLPYYELGSALRLNIAAAAVAPPKPEPAADNKIPGSATGASNPAAPGNPAAPPNKEIDPSKPMIALTFDDGPSANTGRILDVLKQYNGRATFFVTGNRVANYRGTILRAQELGCEIAGHSWNHKDLTKLSESSIRAQILDVEKAIYSVTGVSPPIYRPPYGAQDSKVRRVSGELGYALIMWSVDTLDWKYRNANYIYNAVMKGESDGAIVLCHDLHSTTADAMERVIPELVSRGYQLVTVSELIYHRAGKPEAGKSYNKLTK